jgi:hypothetical protein
MEHSFQVAGPRAHVPQSSSQWLTLAAMPLTEKQAFVAMFRFLDDWWERNGRPDEVGTLLGSLNPDLASDGGPADPAMWTEWLTAVRAVQDGPPE